MRRRSSSSNSSVEAPASASSVAKERCRGSGLSRRSLTTSSLGSSPRLPAVIAPAMAIDLMIFLITTRRSVVIRAEVPFGTPHDHERLAQVHVLAGNEVPVIPTYRVCRVPKRLLDGESRIHRQGDAGDVSARLAAEVDHRFGNVGGFDSRNRYRSL